MKKLKYLPTILMLVLCVGILAIGIYAIKPTKNNISGSVTVNASNAEIEITVYHTEISESNLICGPYTVRSGTELNVTHEALNFSSDGANDISEVEQKQIIFEIRNLSTNDLGAYFLEGVLPDNGMATAENIASEKILGEMNEDGETNEYIKATYSSYTQIPAQDAASCIITLQLLKFLDSDKTLNLEDFGIILNVEPFNEQLVSDDNVSELSYELNNGTLIVYNDYAFTETDWRKDTLVANAVVVKRGVTVPSFAFVDAENIKTVTFESGVVGVADMSFISCPSLTDIVVEDSQFIFEAMSFLDCKAIQNVDYSVGGDGFSFVNGVLSITNDSYSQYQIMGMGGLVLSAEINQGVTTITDYLFAGCYGLNSIQIPSTVQSIGSVAFYMTGLTDVSVPSSVTSIGFTAFGYCDKLKTIEILGNDVSFMGSIVGCGAPGDAGIYTDLVIDSALETVRYSCSGSGYTLQNGHLTITDSNAFNFSLLDTGGLVTSVEFGTGVTSIPNSAFYLFAGLREVDLANIESIGEMAFAASGVTRITNTGSLKTIGDNAFVMSLLEEITIPSSVESVGSMAFAVCPNLVDVTISCGIGPLGDQCFSICRSLRNVSFQYSCDEFRFENGDLYLNKDIGYIDTSDNLPEYMKLCGLILNAEIESTVTSIGMIFSGSASLTQLVLPEGLEIILPGALASTGIAEIEIPRNVTTIGYGSFEWCLNLTSVRVLGQNTEINADAFMGCTKLTTISLPN